MSCCGETPTLVQLDDVLASLPGFVSPVQKSEDVGLAEALGRVTATDVFAAYDLPPFDNSGMDGFAFCHAEAKAGRLRIVGEAWAGEPFAGHLQPGTAIRVATGAAIPIGADTVAMQECARVEDGFLVMDPVPPLGSHVRHAGNDIAKNNLALNAGHRLRAQDIALLGALGHRKVRVLRLLRVAIAATGAELREAGAALAAGQIIDTNSLMLRHLFAGRPVEITMLGAWPDDRALVDRNLLEAAANFDLIVTTGGVSVGAKDYIRDALRELGRIHFWKTAIRPGKPVMLGSVGGCLVLGLPGNPVSALVTFLLIGQALVQCLLGIAGVACPFITVTLAEPVVPDKVLRCFPRARLENRVGRYYAVPLAEQGSNLITSLVQSDGVLDLPAGGAVLLPGSDVRFLPYIS